MRRTLVVTLCLLVVAGTLPVAVADGSTAASTSGTPTGSMADASAATPPNETANQSNKSMGAAFSTFAQSSATEAESSVDNGMWGAAWRSSADNQSRTELVQSRTTVLEQRVEELERQLAQLRERRSDMNPVAYRAQLARLTSQLSALGEALDQTETAAEEVGADTATLQTIRANASELSGPDVAEMAHELAGEGGPEDVPGLGADGAQGDGSGPGNQSNQSVSVTTPGNETDVGNETDGDDPLTGGDDGDSDDGVLPTVDDATLTVRERIATLDR
ncbi:hypothetical protein [Haloarchaeobius sp. HRN-SO-5]|uniref:hypothetical protein n=1 Tax=Haloarchaeobius sp. HRN-SO-5 TaxID=3446118 RepID=UPI003EBC316D